MAKKSSKAAAELRSLEKQHLRYKNSGSLSLRPECWTWAGIVASCYKAYGKSGNTIESSIKLHQKFLKQLQEHRRISRRLQRLTGKGSHELLLNSATQIRPKTKATDSTPNSQKSVKANKTTIKTTKVVASNTKQTNNHKIKKHISSRGNLSKTKKTSIKPVTGKTICDKLTTTNSAKNMLDKKQSEKLLSSDQISQYNDVYQEKSLDDASSKSTIGENSTKFNLLSGSSINDDELITSFPQLPEMIGNTGNHVKPTAVGFKLVNIQKNKALRELNRLMKKWNKTDEAEREKKIIVFDI